MSKTITTIEDLKNDPQNINRGTPRGHGIIERSVRQRGAGRSGLATKDGTIIAGNQTLLKMAELGIPIRAVHTTGDEWVVVVRDDLEPGSEEARLLALEDNRASEVGYDPDPALLAELAGEVDLSGLYFEHELAALLEREGTAILDANDLWKGMPEFEQDDLGAWKSIHVHFANKQDYEAFGRLVNQVLTDKTRSIWHPYRKVVGIERGASFEDES